VRVTRIGLRRCFEWSRVEGKEEVKMKETSIDRGAGPGRGREEKARRVCVLVWAKGAERRKRMAELGSVV